MVLCFKFCRPRWVTYRHSTLSDKGKRLLIPAASQNERYRCWAVAYNAFVAAAMLIVVKCCFQLGDIQCRNRSSTSTCRQRGTPVGTGEACVQEVKKTDKLFGDRVSAAVFWIPGICFAVSVMQCRPHKNASIHRSLAN